MKTVSRQTLVFLGLLALIFLAPFFASNNFQLFLWRQIAFFTMLTIGLSLVMGYAGQVSLGHATFYGLGAYTAAILSKTFGVPPLLALLAALLFTALVGFVIGIPILRLRGHYLAMATLGLNVIFILIVKNEVALTGGPSGFTDIPPLSIGPLILESDRDTFYLAWVCVLLTLWLSLNIVNSHVGRVLRAIHTSEVAAETLGVDANSFKIRVFALAAAFAGLAGGLFAFSVRFISPSSFDLLVSVELVTMAVVGGLANVWGALVGAGAVVYLAEAIRTFMTEVMGVTGEQELIAFGLLLIVIVIFMPQGMITGIAQRLRGWPQWRKSSRPTE